MKYINILLIVALFFIHTAIVNGAANEKLQIEFTTNKFYSHFLFSQALANSPATSPTFKMFFEESEFAQKSDIQAAIQKIEGINTFYEYQFEGYPNHRQNSTQAWQLLKLAASNSSDIDDFSSRIMGMLPVSDLVNLVESLNALEEVHEQLVWQPNEVKLKVFLEKLRSEAQKGDFQNDFQQAAKFYSSTWNHSIPFKVHILPMPAMEGGVYEIATPEGNTLTYSIAMRKDRDLAKDLGVIFHELCHVLYKNQASEIQHEQEKIFLSHPSQYKTSAYKVLDEALATALGQGWYYKQLTGKLDTNMWYAVEQVNNVGKAIYTLVEEFVDANKALDASFVNRYLELYESKFEDELYKISSNMSDVNLWMDESMADPNTLFPYFFQNFNMRSIQEFESLDEQNFTDWQNTLGTKMVIIDTKSKGYDFVKQKIDWLPKMDDAKDVLLTNMVNGEQYYILVVSDFEAVEKAFKLLAERKKIKNKLEKIDL